MNKPRPRFLLPLLILLLSLAALFAARVYTASTQLLRDVNALQALGGETSQPGQLETLITQTARDYRDLRGALGPSVYLAPLFSWLPNYGGDLENAPALLDLGDRVVAGAENALPILNALDSKNIIQSPGAAFLSVINAQKNTLAQSRRDYTEAAQARARIDANKLSPTARHTLDRIDQVLPAWQIALDAADIAPAQLGEERPRVYLLLAQNSDELRATGGFISSVALVRVQGGDISVSDFQDSYAVDDMSRFHPQPPVALTQYMFAGLLLLRDSNWFPDFPTSARAAMNIYRVDRGITTDGVIAVNFKGIPRLLEAVDGVTVEPGSEHVDAVNVMTKVRTYWAPPEGKGPTPEWWTRRKDFMGQLLDAVMQKIKRGDFSRVKLVQGLTEAIAAKDLLVYLRDVDESQQAKYFWSGALWREPGDALMIVDSNIGFNKVDGTVERRAEYAPVLDRDGSIRAALTITYTNLSASDGNPCVHQAFYPPTYAELQQGCYWNYLRVVTPAGSQLVRAEGVDDAVTEAPLAGRAVFGGYFVLARGESRVVRFEYTVPASARSKSQYDLTLEKEPGAPPLPLRVRVTIPGKNAADFSVLLDRNEKLSVDADSSLALMGVMMAGALGASVVIVGALRRFKRK